MSYYSSHDSLEPGSVFTAADGTQEVLHHSVQHYFGLRADSSLSWVDRNILNPTASSLDVLLAGGICLLLLILRLLFCGVSGQKWTNREALVHRIARRSGMVKPQKLGKFSENLWYSCWHSFSLCWGLVVLYFEAGPSLGGWLFAHLLQPDGRWYFLATHAEFVSGVAVGWPLLPQNFCCSLYYITQISFWLSCLVYIRLETVRSDSMAMFVHHIATTFLLFISYINSNWRIGVVTIVLHDIVDVFLYATKTLHYTRCDARVVEVGFGLFAISYFLARLVLFPIYCVWPLLNSSLLRHCSGEMFTTIRDMPGGALCSVSFTVLLALHVFWFHLVVKMVLKASRNRKPFSVCSGGDVRSDTSSGSETEGEHYLDTKENVKSAGIQSLRRTKSIGSGGRSTSGDTGGRGGGVGIRSRGSPLTSSSTTVGEDEDSSSISSERGNRP